MFPPKSLGLALAACFCVAAARQSLSNFPGDCAFTVDRSKYDLCPLFLDRGQNRIVKVHADLTPDTQLLYEISFNGPLSAQNGEEAEPRCPPGTWACLREHLTDFQDSESHFTQAIPIAGPHAIGTPHSKTSSRLEVDAYRGTHDVELGIVLKEGIWRNEPQAAHFRLICNQHVQEPSLPKFIGITAGSHNFEWTTSHACAKGPLGFNVLEQEESAPPEEDGAQPEGDGSQELVDSLPVHHTVRNLMIWFAMASTAILGLGYLVRCPPPKIKRWVGATAKKLPFRVGEGILVQWAEEAMFINDEEDVMVNYEEEYDSDEQIPLKPSPTRLSVRFMDYGSARR